MTKKHPSSKPPSSYISQQAITSTALVKPHEFTLRYHIKQKTLKVGRVGNIVHLARVNPMLYFCCLPEEHETV